MLWYASLWQPRDDRHGNSGEEPAQRGTDEKNGERCWRKTYREVLLTSGTAGRQRGFQVRGSGRGGSRGPSQGRAGDFSFSGRERVSARRAFSTNCPPGVPPLAPIGDALDAFRSLTET